MSGNGTIIALGMFDGVHIGHQKLLQTAVWLARAEGLEAVAYTFSNHPMSVFSHAPSLLMTLEERVAAIKAQGIDRVETSAFTQAFAQLLPEAFARLLVEQYGMKTAVAGFNYSFGRLGAGNVQTLTHLGEQLGFAVEVVPAVSLAGREVSSTEIRRCLADGNAALAASYLGRSYALCGTVSPNRHIGTGIGYPTANLLPPPDKLLPRFGVYATSATVEQGTYPAVTNVGNNPTVGGNRVTIETHILADVGSLYGKRLRIEFHDWIRAQICFADKNELAQQISRDVETARKCFQQQDFQGFSGK